MSAVVPIDGDKRGGIKKAIDHAKVVVANNGFINIDYLLRYHLGINPDELNDEEWAIAIEA